ncbi:MAG TPA: tetratricopeptide repeat protein [Vicinamibacterales bacterium]|nr:tetratricopeptide repeat protein [Vicinamibacterales bacterium]
MIELLLTVTLALQTAAPRPAVTPDLQRAQQHDHAGWARIDAKDFDGAAREFEAAVQIHPEYADALHGLGKAYMALQRYEPAVRVLERCRDSYARSGTQEAEHRVLANHAREDQVRTLQRRLAALESSPASGGSGSGALPVGTNAEVSDIKEQIRILEGQRDVGEVVGQPTPVPAFISLALGSAYFRVGRLPDAERQFRDALAVDAKFGEAHSNLALVCLLTGRAAEADEHVRLAEEAKFRVNPELKRQIRTALGKL